MAITRKDIRRRLMGSGYCNDGVVSTTTATGTTTTLIDTSIVNPDDFWNYGQILLITGTNAGSARFIADWVQSTGTFTLTKPTANSIASDVEYEAHSIFSADDKNEAINEAILSAELRWPNYTENSSLTMTTGTFEYSLASFNPAIERLFGIDEILYQETAGKPYVHLDNRWWKVRDNGGTLTLVLHKIPVNGANMRVRYRARPNILNSDSDVLDVESKTFYNYICLKAASILFGNRALKNPDSHWAFNANLFNQMAQNILYQFEAGDEGHVRSEVEAFNLQLMQLQQKRRG